MQIASPIAVTVGGSVNPVVNAITRLIQDSSESTYRLASGNRLTRAGEDPASLSTAQQLQAQISGLRQGLLNSSIGDNLLQKAYAGLETINAILEEQRALAAEASQGGLTPNQRTLLDVSFQRLREDIDAVVTTTRFGGVSLLDGTASPFLFTVGADPAIRITINDVRSATVFGGAMPDIATQTAAQAALPVVDAAIATVELELASVRAGQSALNAADRAINSSIFNLDTARGALVDTDIPGETARLAVLNIRQQAALSVSAQAQTLPSDLLGLLTLNLPVFDFLAVEE